MIPFHPINLVDATFIYEWIAENLIPCGKDSSWFDMYYGKEKFGERYSVNLYSLFGYWESIPSHNYLYVEHDTTSDVEMFTFALEWIGDDLRIDFNCPSDSAVNCLGRLLYEFGGLPAGIYLIEW